MHSMRNAMASMTAFPKARMKDSSTIKIVLVDDHPLIRQAARMWLETHEDLKVIAEARDGKEALAIATKLKPDVVILDISMPKLNGLEVTRQIVSKCPGTKVLVLTVHTDRETIRGVLQAGASGYLPKTVSGDEVVHSVRAVCAGERVLPSESLDNESEVNNAPHSQRTSPIDLTSRELKILRLVANGLANKEIAAKTGMSLRSVKAILTVIYIKLGAASRTEATTIALNSGILSLNDIKR